MINEEVLVQLIQIAFLPYVPALGGFVIAILLILAAYLLLKDRFLKL
ncbi:MAG: hypothetical protein SF123_07550 [Chloroflexota bacterium]|nr:hypothetical protein [Chloroflexota bacterium]